MRIGCRFVERNLKMFFRDCQGTLVEKVLETLDNMVAGVKFNVLVQVRVMAVALL